MAAHVAAVNTPSLVVLGLWSAMAAVGYEVESTDDPWAQVHTGEVMLVGIREESDVGLLREVVSYETPMSVVGLLDPMSAERMEMCFGAGACGCASMDWSRRTGSDGRRGRTERSRPLTGCDGT